MSVGFSNSGTLNIYNRIIPFSSSGTIFFYDEERLTQIYSSPYSVSGDRGSLAYIINDMHTSKDKYFVNIGSKGYVGENRYYSGLSPTIEILDEDYIEPFYPTSGTEILYQNFESGAASGMTLNVYGTGILSSGVQASTQLEGAYNVGLGASADASLYITPTDPAASGLIKGRTIFLMNLGFDSGTNDQVVGFSFLRQGSALNSNGYKLFLRSDPTNSERFNICCSYGQLGSATNGVVNGIGTILFQTQIDFYSLDVKRSYRKNWLIVEWEVDTSPVSLIKIACYHKLYSVGDTIESVRSNSKLIRQHIFCGDQNGNGLYTSTSQPVQWFLATDNNSTVRIDSIYLEDIDNTIDEGLFNSGLQILDYTTGSSPKMQVYNTLLNVGTDSGPLGSVYDASTRNPLIPSSKSIYGISRYGHSGPIFDRFATNSSHRAFMSFYFTNTLASGIKHGVFRSAIRIGPDASNKFGFSFLAQGASITDNAYSVVFYRNGVDDYRLQIRKGAILTGVATTAVDFGGSILLTSSSLSSIIEGSLIWIEVRWRASTSTEIEVYYNILRTGNGDINIDYSPGNVDYGLVSVLDTADSSSPYLTTSVSPVITSIVRDDASLIRERWLKIELRRAKLGNS